MVPGFPHSHAHFAYTYRWWCRFRMSALGVVREMSPQFTSNIIPTLPCCNLWPFFFGGKPIALKYPPSSPLLLYERMHLAIAAACLPGHRQTKMINHRVRSQALRLHRLARLINQIST